MCTEHSHFRNALDFADRLGSAACADAIFAPGPHRDELTPGEVSWPGNPVPVELARQGPV